MLQRLRRKAWIDVIIAIVSVIFGVIVGPLLERITDPLFSVETRAVLFGILVLGFMIIGGLTAIGIYISRDQLRDDQTINALQEIGKKMGLSAQFVYDLPRGEATGEIYRGATEIISAAQKEILVLSCRSAFAPKIPEEDLRSEDWKTERTRYHQALIQKCKENKGKTLFYRRILQIHEFTEVSNDAIKRNMMSKTAFKHCRELLGLIRKHPEVAVLKYAPVFMQQVFVLVDERYILWEIDALDPEAQSEYMDSVIIFDDVNGELVRYLRDFFMKVDAHSVMVKQIVE